MTPSSNTPASPVAAEYDPLCGVPWDVVRKEERAALAASPGATPEKPIAALAFSGGGIRSATFCLGVIQAFARQGVLKRFDYLSTVSGGGYIGSWLSTLIKRRADGSVAAAETILTSSTPPAAALRGETPMDSSHEDIAVQWLRRYSNYLTPRVGFAGVDTWTAISTYARNLTLNWLVLAPLLVAVILLLAALLPASASVQANTVALLIAALIALCVVAFSIGRGIDLPRDNIKASALRDDPRQVLVYCGVGTLLTSWLAALALGHVPDAWHQRDAGTWMGWLFFATLANGAAWLIAGIVRQQGRSDKKSPTLKTPDFESGASLQESPGAWIFITAIPGLAAGALAKCWSDARVIWAEDYDWSGLAPAAFDTVIGTPVVMLIVSNAVLLFVGLAKRRMSETDREWLGRLGAILFLLGIAWLLAFGMLWLGAVLRPMFDAGSHWLVGVGAGAWLLQSVAALLVGKSALTGASNDKGAGKPKLEAVMAFAPYIFFAGLVALMGWASFAALQSMHPAVPNTTVIDAPTSLSLALYDATGNALQVIKRVGVWRLAGYASLLFLLSLAMSWRVDINLFSYNRFYGNRLGRAYLGAARERNIAEPRRAHPFTDFDPDDDLALAALARHTDGKPSTVQRPLHIINTALNLTGSPDLAWQSRKSASFTFTPLHSGFALPSAANTDGVQSVPKVEGFRRSFEYGRMASTSEPQKRDGEIDTGVTFGMAFPTSGAAASPNMGAHSSPAYAMLLTIFNVRLGRWFGNPCDPAGAWQQRTPKVSLAALLSELLGRADHRKPWLYLSDGGHFENLGVYELVRRRAPLIVAVDAAQDEDYSFTDLANAIRLCSADFGARIELTDALNGVRPNEKTHVAERGYLFGTVSYPKLGDEPAFEGKFVYIKPTLLANLSADLFEYSQRGTGFPQETTGDQWFSESQFESYRHLGETITTLLCEEAEFRKLL